MLDLIAVISSVQFLLIFSLYAVLMLFLIVCVQTGSMLITMSLT